MATLDSTFRSLAKNLIDSKGKTATLTRETRSFSNATRRNTVTETTYSVKVSPPFPVADRRIDGTAIRVGDMEAIIADSRFQ